MKNSKIIAVLLIAASFSAMAVSFQGLGFLAGGDDESRAVGVSADGLVAVGYADSASGAQAFTWTAVDGMLGLGDLPGGSFESNATDVSADGSVVVGQGNSADGYEAFRWTEAGGLGGIGDLPGGDFMSYAAAVNADGSVVVGRGASTFDEAFIWTEADGMVGLGYLDGGFMLSEAFGVSADGSIVVGRSHSASGIEAFIWDETNDMRSVTDILTTASIDLSGWTLVQANDVSADGTIIVGYGSNPDGDMEAWIADISIVPEPTSLVLLGAFSLLTFRRSAFSALPRSRSALA